MKNISWFIYGGQTKKSISAFLIMATLVFGTALYGNATSSPETVTQILYEKNLGCIVGWISNAEFVKHPSFVFETLPPGVHFEQVNIPANSKLMELIRRPCVVNLK